MPKSVLIVEDDRPIFECLREILELEGYKVIGAAHGQEALQKLENANSSPPDVILLDLMMPVMDGFQFRQKQRENAKISDIPVIAMTAGACTEYNKNQLGLKTVLKKPFELETILKEISSRIH